VLSRLANIVNKSQKLSLAFTAESVQSGIQKTKSSMPDVLLLDLGLPDGHGTNVIHYIQENNLPIGHIVTHISFNS